MLRPVLGRPEPTAEDQRVMFARADAWRDCPIPRARLVEINHLTQDYYATRLPGSWAQPYLAQRFGTDLAGHPLIQPGYAPTGWSSLVHHLRAHQVSDQEMLLAGVALRTRTGTLIDQFRDRVTFPITDPDGTILGFVARRHPDNTDPRVPKYLNTPTTPVFHKADQMYGTLQPGTVPVIVEGPMDAIAVTLAAPGRYSGLAPLGTALTDQQAAQLYGHQTAVIATDADTAGHAAAGRDYWQLTPWNITPQRAQLPQSSDPAAILTAQGPETLRRILDTATPLAGQLIEGLISSLPPDVALPHALHIIAADSPTTWDSATTRLAHQLRIDIDTVKAALARAVTAWNRDPRGTARSWQQLEAELHRHPSPGVDRGSGAALPLSRAASRIPSGRTPRPKAHHSQQRPAPPR